MLQSIIMKSAVPFLIGVIASATSVIGVQRLTSKEIKISCPPPIVTLTCPPPKIEGNGIEIEKIKGLKGKLQITQQYNIVANGDSMLELKLKQMIKGELEGLRIVRCKK